MITRQVTGDIFTSGCRNIAFGINNDGVPGGFAAVIAQQYCGDLNHLGKQPLGTAVSYRTGEHTFHALVCHYRRRGGFDVTHNAITACLNAIKIPDAEEIACVLVGSGPGGQAWGANVQKILEGIQRSDKRVAVYSL